MGSRPEHAVAVADTQERADYIVRRILEHGNDWRLWATLGSRLTTLAESVPEIVLDSIQDVLESEPATFAELFCQEGDGLFGGSCPHAGLLWALERLAWSPDHFSRVAFALAHLADLDPGGQFANRPSESLRSLFLAWIRHSSVPDEHRLAALDEVLRRFPNAGWKLIIGVCPKGHDSISGRELPDWRGWGHDLQQPTLRERVDFANAVIDRALRHVDADAQRWCDIMDILPYFSRERRGEAVALLEDCREPLKSSRASVNLWAKIRHLLNRHRGFPNADWALASEELDKLASVYEDLRPEDPIVANAWLFGHWPDLAEGEVKGYREHLARVERARTAALAALLEHHGDHVVIELARSTAAPGAVGWTFALVCPDEERITSLVVPHVGHAEPSLRDFATGALNRLHGQLGWPALERILEQARTAGLASEQIVDIYLAAPATRETWERLEREADELQRAYWLSIGEAFALDDDNLDDLKYALQHLLDVGRPLPVIKRIAYGSAPVDSTVMIQALELAPACAQASQRWRCEC